MYRADGLKVKKTNGTKVTDYLDGFQYEDDVLQFVPTAEGYYDFANSRYVYNYTDHLGNVRLSYYKNSAGALTILEENNYYPFGLKHTGYNNLAGNPKYNYKYNGKELQETGMYDYGARYYMPDIGRWGVVDPLAELSRRWSPYNYAYNNPIKFIDPDGMLSQSFIDDLWSKSGNNTTWTNDGNGNFSDGKGNSLSDSPPDDITVGSNGKVKNVVTKEGPNRFFDESGKQLFFNDSEDIDDYFLNQKFKVNDKIYIPISFENILKKIISTGLISTFYPLYLRYAIATKKSYDEWDFAEGYLANFIQNPIKNQHTERGDGSTTYLSDSGYFRFGNHNTIFNLYDAGNFMWALAMRLSGFNYYEAKAGSELNEGFQDSAADQNAIKKAYGK